KYVNRVSHLLEGALHVANAAILYHAESEWMNGKKAMLTQKPAKVLLPKPMPNIIKFAKINQLKKKKNF
ncbi:MAG: hypothetical protein LBN23_07960, partial [Paludibacter sp.]|nr:hypothetical protein [Paludibacter sp.]